MIDLAGLPSKVFEDFTSDILVKSLGGISAMSALYLTRHYFQDRWDTLSLAIDAHLRRRSAKEMSYSAFRGIMLRLLRADQSRSGSHFGQFGKEADLDEERRHQTGAEDIHYKPRVFLTIWPLSILRNRELLPSSVRLAEEGLRRLFKDDRVNVAESVGTTSRPDGKTVLVSYRHTIGAALPFTDNKKWPPFAKSILGSMLDPKGCWQNNDGGWAQCDRRYTDSDLYCSAYAIRFLEAALREGEIGEAEKLLAASAVDRTVEFFASRWSRDRWRYGEAISEETAPYILIEIGPVLRTRAPRLLDDVLCFVKEQWLSPSGDLSEIYKNSCSHISVLGLYARVGYALWRSDTQRTDWKFLLDRAIQYRSGPANSAERAYLIEMTYLIDDLVPQATA